MMNNAGIRGFALKMLEERLTTDQKSNPQVRELVRIIKENDEEAGVRFATNFCKSRNIEPQDAVGNALKDFGLSQN